MTWIMLAVYRCLAGPYSQAEGWTSPMLLSRSLYSKVAEDRYAVLLLLDHLCSVLSLLSIHCGHVRVWPAWDVEARRGRHSHKGDVDTSRALTVRALTATEL